jgi:drug/metabolite transporter (DMT)-like permease
MNLNLETEDTMESRAWMIFVGLAGLAWGVYVPLIAQGGKELKNSYASFLCVGIAYFVIAILFPLVILWLRGRMPQWTTAGVAFASLAGVAGAVGALCVIFATFEFKGPKIFVAPVIFALAPVINTVVSLYWQPDKGALHFAMPEESPHWTLYLGIILAGLGAGLVLFSKEYPEWEKAKEKAHARAAATAPQGPAPR